MCHLPSTLNYVMELDQQCRLEKETSCAHRVHTTLNMDNYAHLLGVGRRKGGVLEVHMSPPVRLYKGGIKNTHKLFEIEVYTPQVLRQALQF